MSNPQSRPTRICVLPGDGIGPEVTAPAVAVLERVASSRGLHLEIAERLVGGAAIEAEGSPLPAGTLQLCREADAVLLGAAGGPRWDHLRGDDRPGAATLRLRRELGLAINLRPVRAFPALAGRGPLRPEVTAGTDFVIVRELTGGAYFGEHGRSGEGIAESAHDTIAYSRAEISRVVGFALGLARRRRRRLVSVDKANALWSGRLWRDVATELAAANPDLSVEHSLVDSFAFRMLVEPSRLDVVVTENLLGDILSDEAAAISGSLGLMASASLNPAGGPALYEPIHGSAPEIAGRGLANPLGAILSAALLLEHSLGLPDAAAEVRSAVDAALAAGIRTHDLGGAATTSEVASAVLAALGPPHVEAGAAAAPPDGEVPR
ncbi:MAG TPA: 3-isopropylmalate dehydrogenase [Candidatus Binatia bacterium]|nr:3-isopropylmalate dehydrogenase [Candidatus Binatia bacterium]